jgi:hypothetical protein
MIAEYGIDKCREELLSQPGADKKQVEKDYRDAKARLAAAERAGVEWDHRAGIAPLREQYERANAAERRAAMRMARTKPTTLAGAAALIAYTRRDIMEGEVDWQMVALRAFAVAPERPRLGLVPNQSPCCLTLPRQQSERHRARDVGLGRVKPVLFIVSKIRASPSGSSFRVDAHPDLPLAPRVKVVMQNSNEQRTRLTPGVSVELTKLELLGDLGIL